MQALSDELIFHSKLNYSDQTSYLRQLSEVREALEQGLISNLITEGHITEIEELTRLLEQMDAQAEAGYIDPETDRKFHESLLAPLNNPVAIMLLQVFWRVFDEVLKTENNPIAAAKSADRHHAILLAIKAADARGARVAVRSHFEGLRSRLGMGMQDIDKENLI
jgi:DNA-binding FadR family transcriptional regulator